MTRRARAATAALAAALCAIPGAAAPAMTSMPQAERGAAMVSVGFAVYAPAHLDVLAGDSVMWANDSVRRHTVTPDAGGWDSGTLLPGGAYTRHFATAGAYPYFCRLHAGMTGAVDVRTVLLDTPGAPAGPHTAYPLRGRAARAPGTAVGIEADHGTGFVRVAKTTVADDGTFAASVTPRTSARYRAVAGDAASPAIQVLVLDHRVGMTVVRGARRSVVRVHVTPAAPGGTVVLQVLLRDRFGWWPLQTRRLDRRSRARFAVPRRAVLARAVLTLRDGATVLARSTARPLAGRNSALGPRARVGAPVLVLQALG